MKKKIIGLFLCDLALSSAAMPAATTPLHIIARTGQADYIRPIVMSGIPVDIQDADRCTPLHLAAHYNHIECVRKLLDLNANVFAQDRNDATPLHHAVFQGNSAIVNLLLKHRTKRKEQLLQDLANCTDEALMQEIIAAESDIDTRDNWGCTPLHCAALTGSIACVTTLVEHGANLHTRNKNNKTPKDAAVFGHSNPDFIVAMRGGDLTNEVDYSAVTAYLESKMAEQQQQQLSQQN